MAGFSTASPTAGQGIALPYADTAYLGSDFFLKYPDLLPDVVDSWDNKGFAEMLLLNGQEKVTYSEIISNYEQGPLFRSFAIATVTNTSPGAATITLTADSYTTVGSIIGGTAARSPLMERNIIKLPNRREIRVQSKSTVNGGLGTTYVVTKSDLASDTAFDLGAYLTALLASAPTQRFSINSTASAERSDEPLEGLESPLTRYASQLQIFRTHSEITGSAAGDRYNVNLTAGMIPGMEGMYWYSKQRLEQGIVHSTWKGMQFMFGRGGNFVDKDGGKIVKTSLGVEGYVRAYGNVYDYAVGGFTLGDLNALVARIKFMKGPTDYMWVMGYGLYAQVQAVIQAYLPNNSIRYDQFGNADPRKKFVSFGVNGFNYGGINFHLQESPTFSHPEMTGLPGYDYIDQGVLLPYVKTQVTSYDNGVTAKISLDSVMVRYKEDVNQKSRRLIEYERGIGIHGIDTTKHELLSHEGIQMVKLRCFIWTQRATA